jgi:exopolysaccharide production protein ExoQ
LPGCFRNIWIKNPGPSASGSSAGPRRALHPGSRFSASHKRIDTMPPFLALLLWLVLLFGLLRFDPAKGSRISPALWVPLMWMFIVGSRLPSQWLGGGVGTAAQAFEEGNPLDRTIFIILMLLAIGILMSRSFNWGKFFSRNFALMALLSFALASVLWSDYPFVSFKRWFRDLGNYLMVLIVLSDPRPLEAIHTLLRRLCYFLIPLSILIVKYYPQIGKGYDQWTGFASFNGATTSKNMLGVLCLVSGVFFFWDTVTRWSDRKERSTKRIILVNVAFIAMTLWLLHLADSATSRTCLVLGCMVVAAAHTKTVKRHPAFLTVPISMSLCLYMFLEFGLGIDLNAELAKAVGRNPTLTGRTELWQILLSMHTNPLIGTGYESFWLGSRLQFVWEHFAPGINEAHNGYLDVYLNLGIIGLCLVTWFLISSYRTICRRFRSHSSFGPLALAVWTILPFYNITEAAFKSGLLWLILLLAAIALPERAEDRVPSTAAFENVGITERLPRIPLEPTRLRR